VEEGMDMVEEQEHSTNH
jgi:hypothetical protein